MKKIIYILSIFCLLCTVRTNANADAMTDCMATIGVAQQTFLNPLRTEIFPNATKLEGSAVKQKRAKILTLIAGNIFTHCNAQIAEIAMTPTGKVSFVLNGQKYAFAFNTRDVFEFLDLRTGIMIYNKRSKIPGDVIKLSDIKQLYWSDECSDHTIADNLDDDAAVNKAGQQVFSSYGGSDNEFFLDFEEGNDRRAFPGLVLMDKTNSTTEKIVTFTDLPSAIDAAQNFQSALKNSECSSQGLAVYVVALDVKKDTTDKDDWVLGASIGGGVMAFAGLATALSATTLVAATGSMALVNATLAVAGAASAVPVAGWIVAGVAVAAAGVISLIPGEIENIQQVMVIAGPYNI